MDHRDPHTTDGSTPRSPHNHDLLGSNASGPHRLAYRIGRPNRYATQTRHHHARTRRRRVGV